ncbi:MAG: DUF362 domain-containing protein [Candidatus Bathyarchaeia archaeon]
MITVSSGKDVKECFKSLLEKDLNLKSIFERYDNVILKPNFVMPRRSAISNIELIEEFCRLSQIYGVKLEIIECPGMEFDSSIIRRFLSLDRLASKYGAKINLNPNFTKLNIHGKVLKKIFVVNDVFEKPWINLFKIKTHLITTVSLGAKNLMGLLRYDTRRIMHIKGVNKCLSDVVAILKPTYNIGEAFPAMDGDGPTFGRLRPLNILLGSCNIKELDYFITKEIMGINPSKIEYLADMADYCGKIAGEKDVVVKISPFEEPSTSKIYIAFYNLMYLIDILFYPLSNRHFNEFLYSLRLFGTRPDIVNKTRIKKINSKICKLMAINYEKLKIDYRRCISCMECVDNYPEIFKIMTTRERLKRLLK